MNSLWSEVDAARFHGDLTQQVYASRLLGSDSSLVLHGGGNTSVKVRETNLFGDLEDVLYVKGRGVNLATIEVDGFSPCRLEHLLRLAELHELSDPQMESELRLSMTRPAGPAPSVETLLHAIVPARFVDHTHSDAILTITNTARGEERIREVYGDRMVVIPYRMPGFKLARLCAEIFPRRPDPTTIGMLLMNHGVFSFGDTAKQAYERMIELVTCAEDYLKKEKAWVAPISASVSPPGKRGTGRTDIAALRKQVSDAAGAPMILSVHTDSDTLTFARRPDIAKVSQQGPATPDHVIRTKATPLVGRDIDAYVEAYRRYFGAHGDVSRTMLDPAPRVILDGDLGLCTMGRTAQDAAIAEDIYRHTLQMITRAEQLGGWRVLSARDLFEVEYWDLEQAKLRQGGKPPAFTGEVAMVTGAASGIGKACVSSLLARGAAVVGLDLFDTVIRLHQRPDYLGVQCDLTDEDQVQSALDHAARQFGGLDILVLNAGIFPKSAPVAAMPTDTWRRTLSINLDSNMVLMREGHALLKSSPRGGRVVIIGSKNVPAPGPGAAAYSASKAALQQLARVAALEWGEDRIRVNTVHPNGVFDTGIWTPEVLAARAASYRMSIEEYKTNNVLKTEVTSRDVAELAVELCGPLFARTTGAQIPVDGGNTRII